MANNIIEELWLPIKGYEESYEVSNLGRVRSLDRVITRKNGKLLTLYGRVLAPRKDNAGYARVLLSGKDCRIHRLVAEAFIPNPSLLPCVNHLDGNKDNNAVLNLEWCTHSDNVQHACDTGLLKPTYGNSKLTIEKVKSIRESLGNGGSVKELAFSFGVSETTVYDIKSKVSWKHVV